ncbi:MAG: hypothetical protein QOF10_5724 [Kribbellaceae bacterium]|nr:hypothetical protein [Kribbellaceae bacterium]
MTQPPLPEIPSDRQPPPTEPTVPLPVQYEPPAPAPYQPPAQYQPPVPPPQYQPMQQPVQGIPAGPVLVTIGDIAVEQYRIVTPAGVMPTKGTNWSAMDMSRTEERIPGYAIVLAILFALACLLGLLFLLIKERRTTGFVQVTVQNGQRTHNTHVPAVSPSHIADTLARVNFARTLCV